MAATIFRYDNAGNAQGILSYDSATHDEALDGTDKLTVVSEVSPTKRDRLVWRDDSGMWHEHLVDSTKRKHGANGARTESTCSNSINELYGVIASGDKWRLSVQDILATLLNHTKWTPGACSNFGIVELEVYHKSVRECIAELCELVHGELETSVVVGGSGVGARYARIVRERGNKSVVRQFQYGRNMSSIMREVAADEVYTAVKGYGAKLQEDDKSEYPDRLEVVVTSNMDLRRWGVPLNDGTYAHNYTTYTDAQCTDKTFLTKQCKSVLDSVSKPLVRYEFDTADVGDSLWSDVRLGDRTMCVDELFNPSLELIERVSQIRRNLKGRVQCRIAIGARPNPLIDQFRAAEKTSKKSTGNGTRISSRTPTTTRGAGYDGEGAAGIGDVPSADPISNTEPSRIAVTMPPTKTTYYAGEKIDYSGIVVTLYKSDGSVYTDDWHPDGFAAFEELVFPVEYATYGNGGGVFSDGNGLNALLCSYSSDSYVLPSGQVSGYYQGNVIGHSSVSTTGDIYALAMNEEVAKNPDTFVTSYNGLLYFVQKESWRSGYCQGYYTRSSQGESIDVLAYASAGGARSWRPIKFWDDFTPAGVPESTVEPQGDASDLQRISSDNNIPVQWVEPNSGRTLETTFVLSTYVKPHYTGDSWGGGEGIDVPASSGGGKF